MSPQLSCGDTCQIWTWFIRSNTYFVKLKHVPNRKSINGSPSSPHLRPMLYNCCLFVPLLFVCTFVVCTLLFFVPLLFVCTLIFVYTFVVSSLYVVVMLSPILYYILDNIITRTEYFMTSLSMFCHELIQKLPATKYLKCHHDMDECVQIYIHMLQYKIDFSHLYFKAYNSKHNKKHNKHNKKLWNSQNYFQLEYMLA